jgi:hypothetical protein
MKQAEQGCLLIGDLSGYTGYLAGTELEHAHSVLDAVFGVLIAALEPAFKVQELEGDAIFVYRVDYQPDPSLLLDAVEQSYFAFRRHMRDVIAATTCDCNACRRLPELDLKFVAHYGSFVIDRLGRLGEITGTDVVIAHRLLKNRVPETFGFRAYGLYTDALVRAAGIDPRALGLLPHRESYEHLGEITVYVQDLSARWEADQNTTRVELEDREAFVDLVSDELPADPATIWSYLTVPARRVQWQGLDQVDELSGLGRRGVGTRNHCIHARGTFDEEILDWHPYDHEAVRMFMPRMGSVLASYDLTPSEGGTRLRYRCGRPQGVLLRLMKPMVARQMRSEVTQKFEILKEILAGEPASHPASGEPARGGSTDG